MKKLMTIITSVALVVTGQLYPAVVERPSELKPKVADAPKTTTPTLDLNQSRSSTPTSLSSSARNTPDSGGVLTDEMQRNIEDALARKQLTNIPAEHLALYLKTNTGKVDKRANQLVIIEELGKNQKLVIAHAQEIANAFDRFLSSSVSSKTNLNSLTKEQVILLTTMAETMLKNKQGTYGLMIINNLIKKPDFKLKPTTLILIKRGMLEKNTHTDEFYKTLTTTIDGIADAIDSKAENAISLIDFADLIEASEKTDVENTKIKKWNTAFENASQYVATVMTRQAMNNLSTKDFITLGTVIQMLMEKNPTVGIDLLANYIDSAKLKNLTINDYAQVVAIQKACIDSIKPEILGTLITQNKLDVLVDLLPKILRLEINIKEREDLLKSYTTVLKANKKAVAKRITTAIETVLNKANDLEMLRRVTQAIQLTNDIVKNQELLTTIASKVQAINAGIKNSGDLGASLEIAELAKQVGIDEAQYNQLIANIADKALVLNNAAITQLATIPTTGLENQLRKIAALFNLMKISVNVYSASALANFSAKVKDQSTSLAKSAERFKNNRNFREIQRLYDTLENDIQARWNLLTSPY